MVCKIEVVPEPYFESILKSLTDPAIVHSSKNKNYDYVQK